MALGQLQTTQDARAAAPAPDAALVAAARAGDREAFGWLIERHQTLVCAVTCGGVGDPSRGQELGQATFVEAWRSLASLRDAAKLRPWLCAMAKNIAMNARNQVARDASVSLDDEREPDPHAPDPAEEAALAEERAMLARALAEVPEACRDALILFYWEDKSSARVAEAFGLTDEAARQRVARGRRMLRDHVVAVVEEGLRHARPGREFKVAVLAALPAGTPGVAAAPANSASEAHAKASPGVGMIGALDGEDGPGPAVPEAEVPSAAIYGRHAGMLGIALWVVPICCLAGDWLIAAVVLAGSAVAYLASVGLTLRWPTRYGRIAFWEGLALGALGLAVVNARWEAWTARYRACGWYEPRADWPVWLVNVLLVATLVEVERKLMKQDRLQRSR